MSKTYKCSFCEYTSSKQSNILRHEKRKHKKFFKVCKCGKKFETRHGYYKHAKQCLSTLKKEIDNLKIKYYDDVVCQDSSSAHQNITNNTTNNMTNNISINLFLDKHCGNARNLTDFIKNLKYNLEDVMNAYSNGYTNGITNVVLKGLEDIPAVERPIHCSNKKSGQLFIRDNNQWEEDNVKNKGKTFDLMSKMRTKQFMALEEWEKEHPNWQTNEKESLERCKILQKLLGDNKEMEKNTKKILKEVANKVPLVDVKKNI